MTPATLGILLTGCASRHIDHSAARVVPQQRSFQHVGEIANRCSRDSNGAPATPETSLVFRVGLFFSSRQNDPVLQQAMTLPTAPARIG